MLDLSALIVWQLRQMLTFASRWAKRALNMSSPKCSLRFFQHDLGGFASLGRVQPFCSCASTAELVVHSFLEQLCTSDIRQRDRVDESFRNSWASFHHPCVHQHVSTSTSTHQSRGIPRLMWTGPEIWTPDRCWKNWRTMSRIQHRTCRRAKIRTISCYVESTTNLRQKEKHVNPVDVTHNVRPRHKTCNNISARIFVTVRLRVCSLSEHSVAEILERTRWQERQRNLPSLRESG